MLEKEEANMWWLDPGLRTRGDFTRFDQAEVDIGQSGIAVAFSVEIHILKAGRFCHNLQYL